MEHDTSRQVRRQFWGSNYSADDRKAIVDELVHASRHKDLLTPDALGAFLERIDDVANAYLIRKQALPTWPTLAQKKHQLSRLNKSATAFLAAAADLHAGLWLDVDKRADGLSKNQSLALVSYGLGYGEPELEPVLGVTRTIAEAAQLAREALSEKKARRGPRHNALVAWFAGILAPIYKGATGKKPAANYSLNYGGFHGRATPFVRFVAACLRPIDPAAVTPALGDTVYDYLFRPIKKPKRRGK